MEDSEGKGEDHGQRLAGHPGVAVLFPHVQSYLQKGMVAYQSGEKGSMPRPPRSTPREFGRESRNWTTRCLHST